MAGEITPSTNPALSSAARAASSVRLVRSGTDTSSFPEETTISIVVRSGTLVPAGGSVLMITPAGISSLASVILRTSKPWSRSACAPSSNRAPETSATGMPELAGGRNGWNVPPKVRSQMIKPISTTDAPDPTPQSTPAEGLSLLEAFWILIALVSVFVLKSTPNSLKKSSG